MTLDLNALGNVPGMEEEQPWVCLSGCFQRGFMEEGRLLVKVGRDILWVGAHDWLKREIARSQRRTGIVSFLLD